MIPLKLDGTMDVEKIDNLPSEEYIQVLESMNQEQYLYYSDIAHINESQKGPTKAHKVNYTLEEALKKGLVFDIDSFITKKIKEYKSK